jgi:PKD repeat protein
MKNILLSATIAISLVTSAVAQPWVSPNAKSYTKLSQHQADFNNYWKGKPMPTKKGSGYKQFKRWENFWETRLMPDGTFPTPQKTWATLQAVNAHKNSNAKLANTATNWTSIGPINTTYTTSWSPGHGRTTCIVENPLNPNSLYVGTPAGGIFKTVNGGVSWVCLSNNIASLGISGIAIHPTDTNQIFISTGDIDAGDTYSVGVLKSNDNGATWALAGNAPTASTGNIMYEPNSNTKLWVSASDGLYQSVDNGVTWINVLYTPNGIQEFCFKPNDANTIYAVNNSVFAVSTNNGTSFTTTFNGVNSYNRIAVTAANTNYVYLVAANSNGTNSTAEILRSTDAGQSFTSQQANIPISSQAWYDLALGVSQQNSEEVYFGVLNLYQSNDGGVTGSEINSWSYPTQATYTHADIHRITTLNNKIYVCSDGGLYKSIDNGFSFNDITMSLPTAQIYRISGSKYDKDVLAAGLQDNGGFTYVNGQWRVYAGADGMENIVNPETPSLMYGMSQNGGNGYGGKGFYKTNDGGLTFDFNFAAQLSVSGNWITPMLLDPNNSKRIIAGYDQVYEYDVNNDVWNTLNNPNLTGNVSCMAMYPTNGKVMYVTTGSDLHKTINGGLTWMNLTTFVPSVFSNIISIEVHPTDSNKVWIVYGGYSGGNKVFYTDNGGTSWINITGTLPDIPVNVIKHANDGNDGLYLGTDYGVYYYNTVLNDWISFNTDLPNVIVRDLEINPTADVIRAGTYGRGVWECNLFSPIIVKPIMPKPTASFTNTDTNICKGSTVSFTNTSIFAKSVKWFFQGGTPSTSTSNNPVVTYGTSGVYNVKMVVTNNGGKDSILNTSYILVGLVSSLPLNENFENVSNNVALNSLYKIKVNNVGIKQWDLSENINNVSAYGIDTVCLYIENYSSASGNVSTIETPVYKLNNSNYLLKFDYAYNYYDVNSTDTLVLEYSIDCGATYNQLWNKGGADLVTATTPGLTSYFSPNSDEWLTASINLTAIPLNTDVSFRFKDISDYGNNLYLDNINIKSTVGLNTNFETKNKFTIYPNPTKGEFKLNATLNSNEKYVLTIHNVLGQNIYSKAITNITDLSTIINISNQPRGMYSVTLTGNNSNITQKLIIE